MFPVTKAAFRRFRVAWADCRLALAERRLSKAHDDYWRLKDQLRLIKHKEQPE